MPGPGTCHHGHRVHSLHRPQVRSVLPHLRDPPGRKPELITGLRPLVLILGPVHAAVGLQGIHVAGLTDEPVHRGRPVPVTLVFKQLS
jgi:hypothetical protein